MVTKHNRKSVDSEFGFFQIIIWIVKWIGVGVFFGVLALIINSLPNIGI